MKNKTYVSLHNHTDFSNIKFPDSINTVRDLIDYAYELGLKGVAITDHDCISSYVKIGEHLAQRRKENSDSAWNDFKVIYGNEIYLCRNGLDQSNYVKGEDRYFHFILLAKNEKGNQQIRELSTRAWERSFTYFHRRVPTYFSDLEEIIQLEQGNVIASSACLSGQLPFLIMRAQEQKDMYDAYQEAIKIWVEKIQSIFGKDNFYFELQPGLSDEQTYVNKELIRLSKELDVKCIITTDSHYLKQSGREIHKAYLNSKEGEREVDAFYEATYMMNAEELWGRMKNYISKEDFLTMLENTLEIGNQCEDYDILKPLHLPYIPREDKDQFLKFNIKVTKEQAPNFYKFYESNEPADRQLAIRLHNFLISPKTHGDFFENFKEIDYELGIIWESGIAQNASWSRYLVQMADYCDIIWNEGDSLICPSRGSAGASYVMYALGIIQIDKTREKAPLLFERFMNPERASVLDVDIDVESTKRNRVIAALQAIYGEDKVVRVSTFKTEKAKSAILNAGRGLGIDIDTTRYIASLVGSERGIQHTLQDMYHGNIEKELKPSHAFISEVNKYPKLWSVAQRIEGLINGVGIHAGGIIILDEPLTNRCAVMTTTKGVPVSSFDLHDAEKTGLIKIDLLATEGLSKIRTTLDLLIEYDQIDPEPTLKETYEKIVGIYNIERHDPKMWEMVWNNEIISLFQMEQQSGIQGIALAKPKSLEDLATINSVMRLMASERGAEQPLNKYARFRENPTAWDQEMIRYGLNTEERTLLHSMLDYSSGICAHQEDLYVLLTHKDIAGWSLGKADQVRKAVARKNPADFAALEQEFFDNAKLKELSESLTRYIWNILVYTQRGYSFNLAHTLSYSLIGLQEMNLAYKYPIIFWNTANLIIDSGSGSYELNDDDEEEDDEELLIEELMVEDSTSVVNYGKIASAIGKMQNYGIKILPPNINRSHYTFTPDVERNSIMYGIKGIVRVGDKVVDEIIEKRPYTSPEDFLARVNVNKPQMVNLIKSGAFEDFSPRREIMEWYIDSISGKKNTLNLRNANMLIIQGLIPDELDFERRVFNFNKYIRKFKEGTNLILDNIAFDFYSKHFDQDLLRSQDSNYIILESVWKKIYDKHMDKIRNYIKKNHDEVLNTLNERLYQETWEKYATGTNAKWSMDSVCFYQDEHELDNVNFEKYGIDNFFDLPAEPTVNYSFTTKDGKVITLYNTHLIAGTVIDRDKTKSLITLLTPEGVVSVKAYGVMPQYDKQISAIQSDGKKKVLEKSWFSRGNKIIVQGMKRDEQTFFAKRYRNSPGHHFMLIEEVLSNGDLIVQEERLEIGGEG